MKECANISLPIYNFRFKEHESIEVEKKEKWKAVIINSSCMVPKHSMQKRMWQLYILPTYMVVRKVCELFELKLFSYKTEVEKYFKPNIWIFFSLYINSWIQPNSQTQFNFWPSTFIEKHFSHKQSHISTWKERLRLQFTKFIFPTVHFTLFPFSTEIHKVILPCFIARKLQWDHFNCMYHSLLWEL